MIFVDAHIVPIQLPSLGFDVSGVVARVREISGEVVPAIGGAFVVAAGLFVLYHFLFWVISAKGRGGEIFDANEEKKVRLRDLIKANRAASKSVWKDMQEARRNGEVGKSEGLRLLAKDKMRQADKLEQEDKEAQRIMSEINAGTFQWKTPTLSMKERFEEARDLEATQLMYRNMTETAKAKRQC